jgi:hypothetical protein
MYGDKGRENIWRIVVVGVVELPGVVAPAFQVGFLWILAVVRCFARG